MFLQTVWMLQNHQNVNNDRKRSSGAGLKMNILGKLQQSEFEMIVLWGNNVEGSKMQYKWI